jgi:hypothetical protein
MKIKYLFFGGASDASAADEEMILVHLDHLTHIVNGADDTLELKFKHTSPGSPVATQMDNLTITLTVTNETQRATMLDIAERFARFAKDDSQHVLTVFDSTTGFATKINANISAFRILDEEMA